MDTLAFRDALPLWALYIITVALGLLSAEAGWRLGNYRRQRPDHEEEAPVGAVVGALLAMVFTAVILLIADLDRPQQGLLKVSQQAMLDLIDKIGAPAP